MKKDLDIIIYGATGFTGQLCVKYLQSLNTKVKWAIAGRNKESLKKVSKDCYAEVEIFIADSRAMSCGLYFFSDIKLIIEVHYFQRSTCKF